MQIIADYAGLCRSGVEAAQLRAPFIVFFTALLLRSVLLCYCSLYYSALYIIQFFNSIIHLQKSYECK